jgi:tRNA A37 threonylcarbamoyladenosine dehydratase
LPSVPRAVIYPKTKMETESKEGDLDLFTREKQSNAAYEKIKGRKALVVGCGNVGSVLATILAEGGICDMALIDLDEFSYSDNRQLYSTERNQGKNKAIATAHGIAERTMCYVKPYAGDAMEFFKSGGISAAGHDVFLCVDSV